MFRGKSNLTICSNNFEKKISEKKQDGGRFSEENLTLQDGGMQKQPRKEPSGPQPEMFKTETNYSTIIEMFKSH